MSSIIVTARVENHLNGTFVTASTTVTRSDDFTLGVTEPIPANSGLKVEDVDISDLYIYNGDLTINDAWIAVNGNSKDRWYVKGHVTFAANTDFIFTNSYLPGRTFTGSAPKQAIVYADSTATNGYIDLVNCRVTCIQPDVGITTIMGKKIRRVERCHIDLGSDSVDAWNPTIADIVGNCFGQMSFWANDPKHATDGTHPGWSHNDHIQISGVKPGSRIRVRGNSFDIRMASGVGDVNNAGFQAFTPTRAWGSGLIITPGDGNAAVDISDNWWRYGEVHVALEVQSGGSYNTGNSWTVTGNRHDMGMHPYGGNSYQAIRWGLLTGPVPANVHDNYWLNDANVPVALRGQPLPAPITQGSGTSGKYIIMGTK